MSSGRWKVCQVGNLANDAGLLFILGLHDSFKLFFQFSSSFLGHRQNSPDEHKSEPWSSRFNCSWKDDLVLLMQGAFQEFSVHVSELPRPLTSMVILLQPGPYDSLNTLLHKNGGLWKLSKTLGSAKFNSHLYKAAFIPGCLRTQVNSNVYLLFLPWKGKVKEHVSTIAVWIVFSPKEIRIPLSAFSHTKNLCYLFTLQRPTDCIMGFTFKCGSWTSTNRWICLICIFFVIKLRGKLKCLDLKIKKKPDGKF